MGLITCSNCKKLYDYEKYNGICPKCARYNRENSSEREHMEYHQKYDDGYDHSEQESHHSYHQKYDDNKSLHGDIFEVKTADSVDSNKSQTDKATKAVLLIIGALLFFGFLTFMGPFGIILCVVLFSMLTKFKNKK